MKTKKIISIKRYNELKKVWEKKIYKNKQLSSLKKKTFLKAYKLRVSYLNTWMDEPILQTSDDIKAIQEIIFITRKEVII